MLLTLRRTLCFVEAECKMNRHEAGAEIYTHQRQIVVWCSTSCRNTVTVDAFRTSNLVAFEPRVESISPYTRSCRTCLFAKTSCMQPRKERRVRCSDPQHNDIGTHCVYPPVFVWPFLQLHFAIVLGVKQASSVDTPYFSGQCRVGWCKTLRWTDVLILERFSFTCTQDCNVIFRWHFFCTFMSK